MQRCQPTVSDGNDKDGLLQAAGLEVAVHDGNQHLQKRHRHKLIWGWL